MVQQLARINETTQRTRADVLALHLDRSDVPLPRIGSSLSGKRARDDSDDEPAGNKSQKSWIIDRVNEVSKQAELSILRSNSRGTSLLDQSPFLQQEKYTLYARTPENDLVVTSALEIEARSDYRINSYRLFVVSARRWSRLTICLKIPRTSTYWTLPRISRLENTTRTNVSQPELTAPASLLRQLRKFLDTNDTLMDDAEVQLQVSSGEVIQADTQREVAKRYDTDELSNSPYAEMLQVLDDLGCQMVVESGVAKLAPLGPLYTFISKVESDLVVEVQFPGIASSPDWLNCIKVLRCMTDVPGFASLRGVVTDESRTHLRSYLVDMPRSGFTLLPSETSADSVVPWDKRHKWARQLVEAVAAAHARGLVVGTLADCAIDVLLDSDENVLLWHFKELFRIESVFDLYYPPEFMYLQRWPESTAYEKCPRITPKVDIFHLGLWLWLLADTTGSRSRSPWCRRLCCGMADEPCRDPEHRDPVALPTLGGHVPKYFDDIIAACRAENPADRPAAHTLLKMFPPETSNRQPTSSTATPEATGLDVDALQEPFTLSVWCDHCLSYANSPQCRGRYYHCSVCNVGCFDICPRCFDEGLHCPEDSHLLVEVDEAIVWRVPKRYYSSVQSSGMRQIFQT
jgi:hypothetical protein